MEEKKGIFTGSKEYLEKSFLEELNYKIWSTKGAVFQTEAQKEDIFWIAMSLWKSKFWPPFLKGSVISFITLYDFKKEFNPRATRMMREHEQHKKNIQALKLLQEQEAHHAKNTHLINELRNAILMRYRMK